MRLTITLRPTMNLRIKQLGSILTKQFVLKWLVHVMQGMTILIKIAEPGNVTNAQNSIRFVSKPRACRDYRTKTTQATYRTDSAS